MPIRFEWDSRKSAATGGSTGSEFDEASTVFADTLSITIPDPEHSGNEERWVSLGSSYRQRLLVVVHTEEVSKRDPGCQCAPDRPRRAEGI